MGEVGLNRLEYLYDMEHCELVLISRGYAHRNRAAWEQARLVAYNANYCMGSKTPPPTVSEWITFPWERDAKDEIDSDEDINRLREAVRREEEMNRRNCL